MLTCLVFDSIIEGLMKKQSRHNLKRDRGQFRTLKIIEEQKRKQEFFAELAVALEEKFPKEHIEFFIGDNSRNIPSRTFKKFINSTANQISFPATSQNILEKPYEQSNELKKIDANIMQNRVSLDFSCPKYRKNHFQLRKSLATPKNQESRLDKMPKKMFEVDCRMRKKYERVKERIVFNNSESTFRATNSVRNSPAFQSRPSKTQRACRYNTECSEDSRGEQGRIPKMLFGDMTLRQRKSECEDIGRSFQRLNEQGDKRWLCFGGGILKRYRTRQ